MSLTNCRECQGQVSTEARSCPHGAPGPVSSVSSVNPSSGLEYTSGPVPTKRRSSWWQWPVIVVAGLVIAGAIMSRAAATRDGQPATPTSSSPANRIGTDCRLAMRAPAGRTSRDAIDAFAALRNKDEAGFRALMASGRVALIPEGAIVRILDVASHGNIAFKVRVLNGGPIGEEAWVFYGICK